jgi:hypothetical protein
VLVAGLGELPPAADPAEQPVMARPAMTTAASGLLLIRLPERRARLVRSVMKPSCPIRRVAWPGGWGRAQT